MATRVLALGRRQIKNFLPGKVICIATLNVMDTLDSESMLKRQHIALKIRNGAHGMASALPSADIFAQPGSPICIQIVDPEEKSEYCALIRPGGMDAGKERPRHGVNRTGTTKEGPC